MKNHVFLQIAINKTLVVSSGHLAIPVKESCLRSIGDWFRGNGDDFELQSSTECPGVCALFYFQFKNQSYFYQSH